MADRLSAEQSLSPGESLQSPNGQFSLTLQDDGNLVLYAGSDAVWATGTNGQPVARATMQADGNLVLYSSEGEAVWASNTDGNPGAYLVLQDDQNLVVYSTDNAPVWATDTAV